MIRGVQTTAAITTEQKTIDQLMLINQNVKDK